jgi:NAD(P)-dependent dehydrogenase (short-subunit alcohol dehydrogenase family)
MLIHNGTLRRDSLLDQVAIVTGAGRGIGLETARALLALGARVVIAEVDPRLASEAEAKLCLEFDPTRIIATQTNVGDEADVAELAQTAGKRFGQVDIVINNATVTPMGAVKDVPIAQWDHSYHVNLRGPVLLARHFIPPMLKRNYGVFVCVSSVGAAYMGAYECFKSAQVHLANTLDAELEGTGVHSFTIGPGLVRTPGAEIGIKTLAPLYGKTVEEFYTMSQRQILTAEEAGAGFAAAVVLAEQFRGQEISSRQALALAGIPFGPAKDAPPITDRAAVDLATALSLCRSVSTTLREQSKGWSERSLFERQWMFRDFKKNAGMPVEQWLQRLSELETALEEGDRDSIPSRNVSISRLAHYYEHLMQLAKGYERDPVKLESQLCIMQNWVDEANSLALLLE